MIASCSKTRQRKCMILECDGYARERCFERDGHKCVRCQKTAGIQWAHIITRGILSLRWDLDNNLTLCGGCHKFFWHKEPLLAVKWFEETWPARYEHVLAIRSMRIKVDVKAVLEGFRGGVRSEGPDE